MPITITRTPKISIPLPMVRTEIDQWLERPDRARFVHGRTFLGRGIAASPPAPASVPQRAGVPITASLSRST
jgi:hypothetical protein